MSEREIDVDCCYETNNIHSASGNEIHSPWYNNCYSLSLNVISTKAHFYCYSIPLEAAFSSSSSSYFTIFLFPFNKCLIFHYFSRLIFFFVIYYLPLFVRIAFFCAHIPCCCCNDVKARKREHKKFTPKHIKKPFGFDWLLFLGAYSFWVKSEHNNNNDYQKCFSSPLFIPFYACTFCTRFHKQLQERIIICQGTSLRLSSLCCCCCCVKSCK